MKNSHPFRALSFLIGLIVDIRWFGMRFDDVSWDNIWIRSLIAAGLIIPFGIVATLCKMLWLTLIKKDSNRSVSPTSYRWLLLGSLVHYLIALLLLGDAESLFWACLHALILLVGESHEKVLQITGFLSSTKRTTS